jgi:hypothetical protein
MVTESESSDWDKYSGLPDGEENSTGNAGFKNAVQDLVSGLIPSDRTEKDQPIDASNISPSKQDVQNDLFISHSGLNPSDADLKKKDGSVVVNGSNITNSGPLPPLNNSGGKLTTIQESHVTGGQANANIQTSGGLVTNG